MDTYSHVIPGMQEAAAKRLQGILFGSTPVTLPSDGENGAAARDEELEKISRLQGISRARSAGLELATFRFVVLRHAS